MIKFIRKTFTLDGELIEQLRKFAYLNRTTESGVIRSALRFYFKTPKKSTGMDE